MAEFTKPLPELKSWNDLSWRRLANTKEKLKALSYASFMPVAGFPVIKNAAWGKSTAHQAYITLQRPVRNAIHASELIP